MPHRGTRVTHYLTHHCQSYLCSKVNACIPLSLIVAHRWLNKMTKKEPTKKLKKEKFIHVRADRKLKFGLRFATEVLGQSDTAFVERAVMKALREIKIGLPDDKIKRTWTDFYDDSEAVTEIRMLTEPYFTDPELYPLEYYENEERQRKRQFLEAHAPFFFLGKNRQRIHTAWAEALWDRLDDYLAIWTDNRKTDYFAAGQAMAKTLKALGHTPPPWGDDSDF